MRNIFFLLPMTPFRLTRHAISENNTHIYQQNFYFRRNWWSFYSNCMLEYLFVLNYTSLSSFCKFSLNDKEITKQQTLNLGEPVIMRIAHIHIKFEIEIPKQIWVMLRKPFRLRTYVRMDGWTDEVNPVYPPTNFVGQGYKNHVGNLFGIVINI